MIRYLLFAFLLMPFPLMAQSIGGHVADDQGERLAGASVYWLGTTNGTSTDKNGQFQIGIGDISDKRLIISFVGYVTDTLMVDNQKNLKVQLEKSATLKEVQVKSERPGTFISSAEPIKTEVITQTELAKAACCDLAGCFETEGSVQPTTTNIVTNAKELRILGLSGVYNQVLIDGLPLIQGLSYTYGISAIPGTLVDNIYISKGANSVLQGYESISGQINVELKEPDNTDKIFFNAYTNSFLEKQFNLNLSKKWSNWSSLFAAHSTQPANKYDRDQDNFLDLTLVTRYTVYNKWKYKDQEAHGLHTMLGFRYVDELRVGGQTSYNMNSDQGTTSAYGQTIEFTQPEFYTKTGYKFNDNHHLKLMTSGYFQSQSSFYGTTSYKAEQTNAYSNLQHELTWNKKHVIKAGVSFRYTDLNEDIAFGADSLNRTYSGRYNKHEEIPGVFLENTANWQDNTLTLITGIRADKHNQFGWFATPRTLLKYNITENSTARFSVGTGWRTINLFSENINLLASSRDITIEESLEPERATNYGANFTHRFSGQIVEVQTTLDFYRTEFINQIFPDYDSPTQALISNFDGPSVSNGFQGEIAFGFYETAEVKAIYNYLDVYREIAGNKFQLPFNSTHRFLTTLSYKPLSKKWHADLNLHWYGKQRLAKTSAIPNEYQIADESEPYNVVNMQVTKTWKYLEVYIGCENIADFRQKRPIISWQNPFSPYFDTSSVWGPTRGREIYIGLKFKVE